MNKTIILNGILIIFGIISLSILIWGFDKGFDMSDGGFYLLRYQDSQPIGSADVRFDHVLVRSIIPQSLRSIKSLRYIGFCINLLSTFVFSLAISKAFRKIHGHGINKILLFLLMVGGLVLSYGGSPSELSYNSLNQFFLILSAALLVMSFVHETKGSLVLTVLSGMAASFLYLTKVPSGIALSIVGGFALLISGGERYRRILAFWGSSIIMLLAFSWIVKPNFITYYYTALTASGSGSGYGPWLLIKTLVKLIFVILRVGAYSLVIGAAILLHKKYNGVSKSWSRVFITLGILLIILAYGYYVINHLQGEMVLSEFFLLTIFLLIIKYILINTDAGFGIKDSIKSLRPIIDHKAIFLLLVAAPYIGAYGTNNPLNWSAKFYYVCFTGLIALLYPFTRSKACKTVVMILAIYTTCIGIYLYVQHPYRYRKPLYAQTQEYKSIKYDSDTYGFIMNTEELLKEYGFTKEQGMIVAYRTPGLAYLMGTYHPGGILWRESGQEGYFNNLKKQNLMYKPAIVSLVKPLSSDFVNGFEFATGLSLDMDYGPPKKYSWFGEVSAYMYYPLNKIMPLETEL